MGIRRALYRRASALVVLAVLAAGRTVGASPPVTEWQGDFPAVGALAGDVAPAMRPVDVDLDCAARLANPPAGDDARERSAPPVLAAASAESARIAGREGPVRGHALYDLLCTYRL